jgi:hypothetical protein
MHGHPSRGAPARPRRGRRPRLAALVGLLLAVGVAMAGCGGGGSDKTSGVASLGGAGGATSTTRAGASSDLTQAALAYGRCMRQHGINVPDPQITADGIDEQVPAGMRKDDPRLRAARQACRKYLPAGGPPPSPPSAQERQQALAYGRCMRQHGINLPDPQITAKGIRQHPPTDMDRDDPRLSAAEQACHQYGRLPND